MTDLDELQIERYRSYEEASGVSRDAICDLAREGLAAQWRPIEIAPKDGTRVLLWWPHWCSRPVEGFYVKDSRARIKWSADCALTAQDDDPGPTHWMPLPNPPAPQARGEGELSPVRKAERIADKYGFNRDGELCHDIADAIYSSATPIADESQQPQIGNSPGLAGTPSHDAGTKEREDQISDESIKIHAIERRLDGMLARVDSLIESNEQTRAALHAGELEEIRDDTRNPEHEGRSTVAPSPSPSVVSEGAPICDCVQPDQSKDFVAIHVDCPIHGLQPQPSVGDVISRVEAENAKWQGDCPRAYLLALTHLRQQAKEIERLTKLVGFRAVVNRDHVALKDAQLSEARAEIERLAKEKLIAETHELELRQIHKEDRVEIERLRSRIQETIVDCDIGLSNETLAKRLRAALRESEG